MLNWFHNLPMSQKLHRKSPTASPQKARRVIWGNVWMEEGQGHGGFTWPFSRNDGALAGSTGVLRLGRDLTGPRWGLSRACTQTLGGGWVGLRMSLLLSIPSQMDQRKAPQPGAPAWSPGRGPIVEGLRQLGFVSSCGVLSIVPWVLPLGLAFETLKKWRRTKNPLDESEREEWKSWLKAQHSEN